VRAKKHLKLRNILALIGVAGLAIVILTNHHQLTNFWHLFKTLRWYFIVAVILVQLASYYVNALYYRSILKIFSHDVGLMRLFEGALAANFVNYVVPTAGLAGAGYLSQVLSPDVPRGKGVLTQLMRYALSGLAVVIMLPVGFILILLSGNSGRPIVRIALASALAITIFGVAAVVLVYHERQLRRAAGWTTRHLRRLLPKLKPEALESFIDEFYTGWRAMTKQKRRMLVPIAWSIIYIIIEIATFYLVFVAFGKAVNPGIVIMAYLFANIASIFGGLFFSTGIFELGMAGTLVALGLPFVLALSVTTVYRILNLLIGLPPGLYYYKKYLPR
jgi:uncharacterized protein (TIRG00374 family)